MRIELTETGSRDAHRMNDDELKLTENSLSGQSKTRVGARIGTGLYAQVVEDVGQRIVNGELPVGSIIFAEHLCERLGISRSVVREGIRTLSSMGLLEAKPQLGTRVLPRENWDLLNPHLVKWRGQGPDQLQQMQELLEVRMGVEQAAVHFASERMSRETAERLVAASKAMQRAFLAEDTYSFFEADAEFHRLILEGSGNPIIAQFSDTVSTALLLRGNEVGTPGAHSINESSVQRHLDLAQALLRRDAAVGQAIIVEIIRATLNE